MQAIHFICRRNEDAGLRNMTFDKATRLHHSGRWDISEDNARLLVGGWIYLHPSKAGRSEFGGIIVGFDPVVIEEAGHSRRIVFHVERSRKASGNDGAAKIMPWRTEAASSISAFLMSLPRSDQASRQPTRLPITPRAASGRPP